MQRIFISGSKGFIGKNLVQFLQEDHQILSPCRKDLELVDREAVTKYFVNNMPIDFILNSAMVVVNRNTLRSPEQCLYENLMSFQNLFQHQADCIRFIQFGSGAEYCKPLAHENMLEEDCGASIPSDAYGMAKYYSSKTLEYFGEIGKTVNLRLFGVFGPHEDYSQRFISQAIVRSLLNKPIIINQNAVFDYLYIDDLSKIVKYMLTNAPTYKVFNVTPDHSYSLLELAEMIVDLVGNKQGIIIKNSKIKEYYTGSNKRLRSFLPNSFEFTPIKMAIEELGGWYEENIEKIDKRQLENLTK